MGQIGLRTFQAVLVAKLFHQFVVFAIGLGVEPARIEEVAGDAV